MAKLSSKKRKKSLFYEEKSLVGLTNKVKPKKMACNNQTEKNER
jgi:hypothetical protein